MTRKRQARNGPSRPARSSKVRVVHEVCTAAAFNALRHRLPRAARRDVEQVPDGHVGLVVQAIAEPDVLLVTVYGRTPAGADPARALARLEAELLERLG